MFCVQNRDGLNIQLILGYVSISCLLFLQCIFSCSDGYRQHATFDLTLTVYYYQHICALVLSSDSFSYSKLRIIVFGNLIMLNIWCMFSFNNFNFIEFWLNFKQVVCS